MDFRSLGIMTQSEETSEKRGLAPCQQKVKCREKRNARCLSPFFRVATSNAVDRRKVGQAPKPRKHAMQGKISRAAFGASPIFRLRFHFVIITLVASSCLADSPAVQKHVVVFAEQGKFAGWPAGHGAWSWGDEILVGFSVGRHRDLGSGHAIDREKPEHHVLARSLDGGESWKIERPSEKGMLVHLGGMRKGITDPALTEKAPTAIRQPINFAHPDFCMTLRLMQINGGFSRIFFSYDRGHNWSGPFHLPSFGQPGVMARTDYVVNGRRDCHVFLTVAKSNGGEGRVIAARTTDGGLSWAMLSFVGPEPRGFSIMPSTVRVSDNKLVMATRRRGGGEEADDRWIDAWKSDNDGDSWTLLGNVVDNVGRGNPPSLLKLGDGRLCVTYGVREPPYEICAKLSTDDGETWSDPIVLQHGGGGWDIGYTRTVQRTDGKFVTIYYYHLNDPPFHQIFATIWSAPSS